MKLSLLARLQVYGRYYLIGALLLILGVPLYQLLVLNPLQYGATLNSNGANHFSLYLSWLNNHIFLYIIYRILLIFAFLLLLTLPFSLFRIIVAQEILDQQERAEDEDEDEDQLDQQDEQNEEDQEEAKASEEDGMPAYAWRGKGFAVIAAWAGFFGIWAYIIGAIIGTFYLVFVSHGFTTHMAVPTNFTLFYSIFSFISNASGIGLLALATLFFGALITRRGRYLWPPVWILFGYTALATAALLSGSAVASASAPTEQAALTTPAFLLFGLWVLWLGTMLVRLRPE